MKEKREKVVVYALTALEGDEERKGQELRKEQNLEKFHFS